MEGITEYKSKCIWVLRLQSHLHLVTEITWIGCQCWFWLCREIAKNLTYSTFKKVLKVQYTDFSKCENLKKILVLPNVYITYMEIRSVIKWAIHNRLTENSFLCDFVCLSFMLYISYFISTFNQIKYYDLCS